MGKKMRLISVGLLVTILFIVISLTLAPHQKVQGASLRDPFPQTVTVTKVATINTYPPVSPTVNNFVGISATQRGCANPINSFCPAGHDGSDALLLNCRWGHNWSWHTSQMIIGTVTIWTEADRFFTDTLEWIPRLYGYLADDPEQSHGRYAYLTDTPERPQEGYHFLTDASPCPSMDQTSLWLFGPNEPHWGLGLTPEQLAETYHRMWECFGTTHPFHIGPSVYGNGAVQYVIDTRRAYYDRYGEYPHWSALSYHGYGMDINAIKRDINKLGRLAEQWGISGGVIVDEWAGPPYFVDTQEWLALRLWFENNRHVSRYAWFATRYEGTEPWAWGYVNLTSLIECENAPWGPVLNHWGRFYATDFNHRLFLPSTISGS